MALSKESKLYLIDGMTSAVYGNELIKAIEGGLTLSSGAMIRLRILFGSKKLADNFQACIKGTYALSAVDVVNIQSCLSMPNSAMAYLVANLLGGLAAGVKFPKVAPIAIPNNPPLNINMPAGFTVAVSNIGPAAQPIITLTLPAASIFPASGPGRYFVVSTGGNSNQYYVWFNKDGANTDPTPLGLIGIEVAILSSDTAAQVAAKLDTALAALAAASHSVLGAVVTIAPAVVVLPQVATPMFSPIAGTYGATQSVAISSATVGATIYYTTNGSTPTVLSSVYSSAVSVSASQTLKALAVKAGYANSLIGTAAYVIGGSQVATPTFSPVAGTYSGSQNVTVSSLTAGATFYYTTNGSTPTTGSTLYSGPIAVSASETLKVLAVKAGLTDSAIASAAYVINALGPSAVDLGTAANYRILTEAGISTTAGSAITGDIAVSPIASTAITGFGLVLDGGGTFSTSALVTGQVFAADYSAPTPANLTTAIGNKNTAYSDAAGRTSPDFLNMGSGEIGGLTLQPGLYKWTTGLSISTDVTLNGGPSDVFIMQISGTLDLAASKQIIFTGGLLPQNVFWQFSGAATLHTSSVARGIFLGATSIAVQTTATVHGRLFAGTAVTLDNDVVSA